METENKRHSEMRGLPQGSSASLPGCIQASLVIDKGLDADFFHKPSGRPQKTVILLGGSEGGKSWSSHTAFIHELLELDCSILSLGYFGIGQLPRHLRAIPLEYFSNAFRWLSMQTGDVMPGDYILVGVSRGAELALLLGSRYSEVKSIVAIAPSSVVFPGPPTGLRDALHGQHSAWSYNGRELAFVPIPYSWTTLQGMLTGRRIRMFEKALQRAGYIEEVVIPVENIRGPVFLASFTHDEVWPSTFMSGQIMQRLDDSRFGYHYEHACYDAGHSRWDIQPCRDDILNFLKKQL